MLVGENRKAGEGVHLMSTAIPKI